MDNFAAYLLKKVTVHTKDGAVLCGTMTSYQPTVVLDGSVDLPIGEIGRIELEGQITDFRTYHAYGEVSLYDTGSSYRFLMSDLADGFPREYILFGEYSCSVAYQLRLDAAGLTYATELRLLSARRDFNRKVLASADFILRYKDGRLLVGRLNGEQDQLILRETREEVPFDPEGLTDIWLAPAINEFVEVALKDGGSYCGRISHTTADCFALLVEREDGGRDARVIRYADLASLRYRGQLKPDKNAKVLQTQAVIDQDPSELKFTIKEPYLRDPDLFGSLTEGVQVCFSPSLTGRYLIAKDVEVLSTTAAPREDPLLYKGIGVILFYKPDKDSGSTFGYIGRQYYHKDYYRDVMGRTTLPSGNVLFYKTDFPYEPNKLYVVRYACDQAPTEGRHQTAQGPVELVASYPRDEYLAITLDEQDQVHALRASVAYLPYFWARSRNMTEPKPLEIEVTAVGGRKLHGFVAECSGQQLTVHTVEGRETVRMEEIEHLRYFSTIISLSRNALGVESGYVSNSIYFHINSLLDDQDKILLNSGSVVGATLSYALRFTAKGLLAEHAVIWQEEKQRGYLSVWGPDSAEFSFGVGSDERKTVFPKSDILLYPLVDPAALPQLLKGSILGVQCRLRSHGQETAVILTGFTGEKRLRGTDVQTGYITMYLKTDSKCYGFITPENQLERKRQNWRQPLKEDLYFSTLANGPDGAPLNTRQYYYRVTYREHGGKAEILKVLEALEKTPPQSPAPESPQKQTTPPAPLPEPRQKESVRETVLDLSDKLAERAGLFGGTGWKLGILTMVTNQFALIAPLFRTAGPDSAPVDPRENVGFYPAQAQFTGIDTPRPKTVKQIHVVRYVPKGTLFNEIKGIEMPTIDYACPVDVLLSLPRNKCILAEPVDTYHLRCRCLGDPEEAPRGEEPAPEGADTPAGTDPELPVLSGQPTPFLPGESVFLTLPDGRKAVDTVRETAQGEPVLEENPDALKSGAVLYRFGIITQFSAQDNLGVLNGTTLFGLDVLEKVCFNVASNQRNSGEVRLHVIWREEDGKVREILAVSEHVLNLLPWVPGRVTRTDIARRELWIDGSRMHCVTVRSDHLVSRRFRENTLTGQDVFCRDVRHPFARPGEKEPKLADIALRVQCAQEEITLKYNADRDIVLGCRNQTFSFPVAGSVPHTGAVDGQLATVRWRIGKDPASLEAWVQGSERFRQEEAVSGGPAIVPAMEPDAELEDIQLSENIRFHPLVKLLHDSVDLRNIRILQSVSLDENGQPLSGQEAQQALGLLQKNGSKHTSFLFNCAALRLLMDFPELPDNCTPQSFNRLLTRLLFGRVYQTANFTDMSFGSANYYLSVLIANAPTGKEFRNESMRRLFLPDFVDPADLRSLYSAGSDPSWQDMLRQSQARENQLQNLVSQLLLLDRTSAEQVIGCVEENKTLSGQLAGYLLRHMTDRTAPADAAESLRLLQGQYRLLRQAVHGRLHGILTSPRLSLKDLQDWLQNAVGPMLWMMCREDAHRFRTLTTLCGRLTRYNSNYHEFRAQNQELKNIRREVEQLKTEIRQAPCRESAELLILPVEGASRSLLDRLLDEVHLEQKALYQNSAPIIVVKTGIDDTLVFGEQTKQLIVINNELHRLNCQPALQVEIRFESLTEGVQAGSEQAITLAELNNADVAEILVPFAVDLDPGHTDSAAVDVQWRAVYRYETDETEEGLKQAECTGTLTLEVAAQNSHRKNPAAVNPYQKAADGQALNGDEEIFISRDEQFDAIWSSLFTGGDDGWHYNQGSTVILYGQRKCGKTSLVNNLLGRITSDPKLREQTILILYLDYFAVHGADMDSLREFRDAQYLFLFKRFWDDVEKHPQLLKELTEANLLPPREEDGLFDLEGVRLAEQFRSYFTRFREWDRGRHSILIISDEYSRIPVRVMDLRDSMDPQEFTRRQLRDIPSYVRSFSQELGFVQLFIGHDSMMRALKSLSTWNHTGEFAKIVELAEFSDEDARTLIIQPTLQAQGYDPYGSALGEKAIRMMQDLSGNKPVFLMRLCDMVYSLFMQRDGTMITDKVVLDAVQKLVNSKGLEQFDALINEDGDDLESMETRDTYRFLACAARCALKSANQRSADISVVKNEIAEQFGDSVDFEKVCSLLEGRRVIRIINSQIFIKTGLFLEYIKYKGL